MLSRRTFLTALFTCCLAFLAWVNFVPQAIAIGGKLPAINQPAPEFTLPTNTGDGEVTLSNLRGKWVVLYFYPSANRSA